jgi:hypothetical protein
MNATYVVCMRVTGLAGMRLHVVLHYTSHVPEFHSLDLSNAAHSVLMRCVVQF